VLHWQNDLEGKLSHSGMMACRSILLRILEAARRERLIPTNPVRDVEAPKPRINPERIFEHERRRTFTPEELGRFLAACRPFYRDHFLAQVGTGLRSGELLGLRRRRVYPELRRIEVIEVRYEVGRFGRGFKAEPKNPASVRVCRCPSRPARLSAASSPPAPGPTIWCSLARAAATASHAAPEPRCPPTTCGGRRNGDTSGSPMGRVYRETTPTMLARVTATPRRTDRPRDGSWRKSAARRRRMDRD
jgi:hypothetical protein